MSRRSVFQMFFECGSMYSRHSGRTKLDCSICSKDSYDSSLVDASLLIVVYRLKWFDPYLESLTPSLSYHTCVILTCVYESRSMTPPLRPVKYHEPGRYLWSSDSCVFLKVVESLQTVKTLLGKRYKRDQYPFTLKKKRGGEVEPSPVAFLMLSDAFILHVFFFFLKNDQHQFFFFLRLMYTNYSLGWN